MKSSSPLSAVMLTTVFFLCSAVFFTNVRPQDPPNDETKANVTGSPLSNVTGPPSNGSQSTTNATLDEHPQEDGRSLIRRGLQPRQRRPLHSCTNAADGEEGAGVEAPPSALRTRIGRKRKMRDDHEVPL
uniref:Uncharacterized protein n=1 Tax=Meloidogyne javanica TaxID=6303 RepID=A0A915MB58_MELJA